MTEAIRKLLIVDSYSNVDYSYGSWDPDLKVWRAGDAGPRELPYMSVDFITTQDKKFPSFGDVVGRINDFRLEYAYCELELVNISIYAAKYHNSGAIRGRDFAYSSMLKLRKRILAYWNDLLFPYNGSVDRGMSMPIRDLTNYQDDVGTRIHELELNVFLRTDVRWYKNMPSETEERAEKAFVIMNDINNIRIDTS